MAGQNPRRPVYARQGLMMYTVGSIDSMHMVYARHFKPHGYRLFCVRMQHESVRRFVKLVEQSTIKNLFLQPDSARYCRQTYGNLPCRLICHQSGLDTVCGRALGAPSLPCRFFFLPHAACRPPREVLARPPSLPVPQ